MSIVSGINRYLQKLEAFEAFGCILDRSARSNVNRRQVAGLDNAQSLHHFLTIALANPRFSTTSPEAD